MPVKNFSTEEASLLFDCFLNAYTPTDTLATSSTSFDSAETLGEVSHIETKTVSLSFTLENRKNVVFINERARSRCILRSS